MQQRQQTGGRGKAYIFLGISIITAVIAAVLVVQLLRRAQEQVKEAKKPDEMVDVVIATRNLYMGLPVQEGDVTVRSLPPAMVPADVVFTSSDLVLGRTPKERILALEIVRTERLARREAGIGLNAVITPGKRAVSLGVKAEEAVAGFIRPLNYVDVIVVIKPDDAKQMGVKAVAKTLLQGIKVLAIGDSLGGLDGDESQATTQAGKATKSSTKSEQRKKKASQSGHVKGKRTVTLEVTPEEAEELALAQEKGDIHLALRADIDITQVETHGATANALIGLDPNEDKPVTTVAVKRRSAPKQEGPKAEVVSGGQTTEVEFNSDGTRDETTQKKRR